MTRRKNGFGRAKNGSKRKAQNQAKLPEAETWVMSDEVIGLELVHVEKSWHYHVYGGGKNPNV